MSDVEGPLAGPLSGVLVIEAASYMSAPLAGMMLADLGAGVVKVEAPGGGDPFRTMGRPATPTSALFANCNHGKRSVVLDLKSEPGRTELRRLLTDADVFLCNWRPGVAESLGFDDAALAAINPRLVRCFVNGYGTGGPLGAEPAFDTVAQAMSGLSDALSADGAPQLLAGYPVDKVTASSAAQAVLAALFARERTGRGERIDLSMLDATAYFQFPELLTNRVFLDHQPEAARNAQALGIRPVPTRDGWMVIAMVTGRQIRDTVQILGHDEWAVELRAIADQGEMVRELFDRVERVTATMDTAELLAGLRAIGVPCAQCLTIDEHLADEQVAHNELYRVEEWPGYGRVRVIRYPAVFSTWGAVGAEGPAPGYPG
jgi:crotonobetainyl-CoA:carnitine CoA-transferase CaiB-like acyl-CoA transferase